MLQFGTWEGAADRFELAPIDGGTTLRVVRTAPALAPDWPEGFDEIVEGWITFVEQLRLLLERHAGATRRTIYLSGKAPERHRQPSSALGIDGRRDAANGSGYTAELPTGDRLTGIVWHRSRHQIGLAVDDWGGGLLVVTDRPKSDSAPHGGGAALLTTFGLADAGLAELEGRWRKWWEGRYPAGSVPVQP